MKPPRWLSPVRTVEAETGWPRELCRKFARSKPWPDRWVAVWIIILMFVVMPIIGATIDSVWTPGATLPLESAPSLDEGAWVWMWAVFKLLAPVTLPSIAAYVIIFLILLYSGLAFLSKRALPRYRAEPWCLKCKYPVPDPIDGRLCANCPECGEPIPAEIATLAAQRGDAKG